MKPKIYLIALLGVLAGLGAGILVGRLERPPVTQTGAAKILYWWDPMMPDYRSDKPGKSPMGMDLVPVYEGQQPAAGTEPAVTISSAVVQNLGIRTAKVERTDLMPRIETYGTVALDASRTVHLHVRRSGWVEKLYVRALGEHVEKGQLMMEIFSPDLIVSASELVREVLHGTPEMAAIARRKLLAMGVSPPQIEEIQRSGAVPDYIKVFAPRTGLVEQLGVAEGMYVQPDATLMSIVDHASVWVLSEVFESQLGLVREGMGAEVRVNGYPGRTWTGKVGYIYPELQSDTRTARLRINIENADLALRENMYATVRLEGIRRENALTIPDEALIRTAKGDRVVLALGEGRFKSVPVKAGITAGERVEILDGLKDGDRVVTSAQFLIDSESSLTAGFERIQGAESPTPAMAEGKVVSLSPDDNKITISHGPIPALAWPAMTMDFTLGSGVSVKDLAPGDLIRFSLVQAVDGSYEAASIERLRPAGAAP